MLGASSWALVANPALHHIRIEIDEAATTAANVASAATARDFHFFFSPIGAVPTKRSGSNACAIMNCSRVPHTKYETQ